MVSKVYGVDGGEAGDIELADEVFNSEVSTGSIYHALRNELANQRVGTASTKTRSAVRGSNAKPWKQKGTGRARAGSKRSPLWVGGGTIFGPHPRDYSYRLPKKLKRLAFRSLLSQKLQDSRLKVVEDFDVDSGKTKELAAILRAFNEDAGVRTVLVVAGEGAMMKRAGRNLPGLSVLSYNRLRAHALFYAGSVLVQRGAALKLNTFYTAAQGSAAEAASGGEPAARPEQRSAAKPVEKDTAPRTKATAKKAPARKAPARKAGAKPAAAGRAGKSSKAPAKKAGAKKKEAS